MQDSLQKDSKIAELACKNEQNPLCKTAKEAASYFSFQAENLGIQFKSIIRLFCCL